ncbi:hypothetical protein [Acidithiobacillus sp. AMEEHan]|uniref:hypothetical protein n=1 Tax=Acidithiobacillus sp. AMEEHan TaxID=2994951 RepID=UPI0027E4794A|nr:hypothetical protein [Acidithiobacillus sp. AMEEHan]
MGLSPLAQRLRSAEQEFLRAQLAAVRNDAAACAQNLGISQRSLDLRLQLCEKRGLHADDT